MADTVVAATRSGSNSEAASLWGPYWINTTTAVIISRDDGADLVFYRTTNDGVDWTETEIEVGACRSTAVWFDQETPGITGNLVHIVWLDSAADDFRYVNVNVSDAVVGTIRNVDTGVTLGTSSEDSRVAITKARDGTLIAALSTLTEIECYKSSDEFATAATDIADVFETATETDYVMLFPANVDDGDVAALFWDRSANDLDLKMYDNSADSWGSPIAIDTSMTDDAVHRNMDGSIRHSDGHLLVAAHSNDDDPGDDLRTWDITVDSILSPTITAKTPIFTNQDASAQCSVFINQQNDDVYVAYLKGGTWVTVDAAVDAVYHISTAAQDMDTWGSEQAYSDATADDIREIPSGRTVGDNGGFYQPAFFNDDTKTDYVNLVNDVAIAAAETFTPVGQLIQSGGMIGMVYF